MLGGRMPLYEYRCLECQHEFEALVPAGRADQAACPECGVEDVRRLLSMFAAPRGAGQVGGASAWETAGTAVGGDGASAPGGCCGGACGTC
jgi:putative FmdB family regulatory protein